MRIEPEIVKAVDVAVKLADEHNLLQQLYEDAAMFEKLYLSAPGLRQLFLSFEIDSGRKKEILANIFEGRISAYLLGLLYLLAEKNKLNKAVSVVHLLKTRAERILRKRRAVITTPIEVEETIKKELEQLARKFADDKLTINYEEDPEIIGGFIMKIGDKLIDASVRGKLLRFKKSVKARL